MRQVPLAFDGKKAFLPPMCDDGRWMKLPRKRFRWALWKIRYAAHLDAPWELTFNITKTKNKLSRGRGIGGLMVKGLL